jgi:protocatechuate 3,4-dioxygenase beta subunit
VWHCDAAGVYSGYESQSRGGGGSPPSGPPPGAGAPGGGGGGGGHEQPSSTTRYLRGHQRSGADGVVRFLTVYPGWYRGRRALLRLRRRTRGRRGYRGSITLGVATS